MDNKHIFRPRARLMLLLGDELIRDAGIAVFELVKNAYDADAKTCQIYLNDIDKDTGDTARIIIHDDGGGMDFNTVKNIWLVPGTENRKEQRETRTRSDKFGRLPLGEKGLGRFAVHKLGSQIKLVTRAANQKEVVVGIDWQKFSQSAYLNEVELDIEERDPEIFLEDQTGTRIIISHLKEKPWTKGKYKALRRSITAICSPFDSPDNFNPVVHPNFDSAENWDKDLMDVESVLESSLFKFQGIIDGDELEYDYEFMPHSLSEKVQSRAIKAQKMKITAGRGKKPVVLDPATIGPVYIELYMYDLANEILKLLDTTPTALKKYLSENGGVKVYRDGVRVYDFGEPGNDWLNLGKSRYDDPSASISNNQVIGAIRLNQDIAGASSLIEKTNREGFVDNDAYDAFRSAVLFAVKQAAAERKKDKDHIRLAYSKTKKVPVLDTIDELRTELAEVPKAPKKLFKLIDRIEIQYRETTDRLMSAAGAGLNLMIVLHEIEKRIYSLSKHAAKKMDPAALEQEAKEISDLVDGIAWLTRQSKLNTINCSEIIAQATHNWRFRFAAHNIDITNGIEAGLCPDHPITVYRRQIMISLMNLIDNSIHWLKGLSQDRKIYIGATKTASGNPAIIVADNGPGFQDAPHEIIEPFFTRRNDGMGLGLHIADEIMKSHGGRLRFPNSDEIELPKEYTGAVVVLEFVEEK